MIKKVYLIVSVLFSIFGFSQDNEQNKFLSIGAGAIYYPTGQIIGFEQSYSFDYFFLKHFGLKLNAAFGNGENIDKYYFDTSKSTVVSIGIIYAPFQNKKNLNLNVSYSKFNTTKIYGTKDEKVDENSYISQFTAYEEDEINGLNLGFQIPIYQNKNFLLASRIDGYASWLQIDAVTAKFVFGYKF